MAYARAFETSEDFYKTLEAAKAGAEWAWADIYRELAGAVTGYLRTRGAADPEDVCSETFLQIARGISDFEGDYEAFRSWVFVIAHRRLIDARRNRTRRPETVHDDDHLASIPGGGEAVDEEAISRFNTAKMSSLFALLTDDQRDVLALRVIADLSVEQTADALGKRTGAVKALQRRALASVRRSMEEAGVTL